ncbi:MULTISPECIES: TRAP transporter substrate-binding protein [unclassified Castellaniella]|uniref:TRAP transporter substrate-binding protein n=1 Tax=unclassified Castellaniella TaxID=2617606 RepID=UPI003316461F
MRISRRQFMHTLGGAATIAATPLWMSQAHAATTLTLGHGAAPGNPRSVGAEKFAALVAEKTGGSVKINVAGSEQLGNDVAMLTSLRTGVLDFTINSQGATGGIVPEINALGLPFLFDSASHAYQILQTDIGADLAARMEAKGLVLLDWWDNGVRQISNSQRPVHEPKDLSGMKIRTPADAMTIDIFKALGAATEQIAFSELYIALQQGVVDGQENPLANIASSKIYEVTPYISLSAHKWESTPFLMSRMALGRLKDAEKQAVREAAREAGDLQRGLMQEADKKYLAQFEADPSIKVNPVDRAAFKKATAPVAAEWQAKPFGDFVKKLITAVG